MRQVARYALILFIAVLTPSLCSSHSGRTDANGGHYNRSTGEYHFHNGGRSATPQKSYSEGRETPNSQTVYITRTGHKYHRDGCRYLKSRIQISLKEARKQYAPCKVCMPPA